MASLLSRVPLLLFLLILLCVFSSVFFFVLNPTCPSSTTTTTHLADLPHDPLNIYPPFTLIIKVLAYNRFASLSRCLNSLSKAYYDTSTTVHLHIFIDHFVQPSPQDPKWSSDLDEKLNLSRKMLDFVDGFKWDFGEKVVHYRTLNVGLQAQWLEAWWPASDREFAFVVEDDLELSPMYFKFLKVLILNYYFNQSNFSPLIFGASLQRPRFVPGKHGNKLEVDGQSPLFLYQLVGSWGQLLFPRPWKEFRLWYDTHKSKGLKPYLEGMVTTRWYKKMGERIWTPWFIKFIHDRGYFDLYTNMDNERALSVSHRDAGSSYGKHVGPDSTLVDENTIDKNLLELQPLTSLKWYDFCFRRVVPYRVIQNSAELELVLNAVPKHHDVILVSLQKASESEVRNLLCHFEILAIRNYILVGKISSLFLDLSRRGYPVIDVDQFSESVKSHKLSNYQEPIKELAKEILVISSVITKSLELKYNTWVMNSNLLPLSSDLNLEPPNPLDYHFGQKSKLIYIRSSSSNDLNLRVDDLVYKAVALSGSSRAHGSLRLDEILLQSLQTLLKEKDVSYDRIDEARLGQNLMDVSDSNLKSPKNDTKFIFWPGQMDSEVLVKKLMQLGLWRLDSELSCPAVVC